jgi:hypothetical protein
MYMYVYTYVHIGAMGGGAVMVAGAGGGRGGAGGKAGGGGGGGGGVDNLPQPHPALPPPTTKSVTFDQSGHQRQLSDGSQANRRLQPPPPGIQLSNCDTTEISNLRHFRYFGS